MASLPIDPLDDVPPGFTEEQRGQPGGFSGEPDVLDTWATSSLTPQIASHWGLDPERHARLFPMDMRPQGHDIIRTWAFYTIVKAYTHEREIPWKNAVISGWILDPDRKKMSKSQGNTVTPEPLLEEHGADSVRYWAARARLGVDTAFDPQVFRVGTRLCTKLFNASKFAIGRFDEIDASQLTLERITHESDRMMIAELRPLLQKAREALEVFDYAQALMLIEEFFWKAFCDNYLELVKARTYDEGLTEGRLSACTTLRLVHRVLVRLFAPYLPYLTEEVWHWVYNSDSGMNDSVHRSPWPSAEEFVAVPAPACLRQYEAAVALIDEVRKAKATAQVSMKAAVQKVTVTTTAEICQALEKTLDDIKRMLHIDEVTLSPGALTPEEGLMRVEVIILNESE
jgi:valyl-tRNA synthetase